MSQGAWPEYSEAKVFLSGMSLMVFLLDVILRAQEVMQPTVKRQLFFPINDT
jgi:hypothetical protein